ncbi:MAG: NB-ARC domain-containing protein [Cyanobacteria bacterium P01_F01_bin.56]
MSKRQRGVVLTDRGLERLEAAIASAQEAAHRDKRFPKEEIAARAQTTTKTLNKIFERVLGVDKSKLRDLFQAFGLGLDTADYGPPDPVTAIAPSPESSLPSSESATKIDWGEKPDTKMFFGRAEELATLRDWVMAEQCRVVTLLGMGGIGKTSLAAKLADRIYDQFDYVIWRSLREAPPLEEILVRLIQFLSDQQETEINLPARLGERLIRLLHYLREHRCLLVLDNLESILQAESTGQFRDGYEGYGELIRRIGEAEHQSCLLLTSRECPRELAPMAGDRLPVRLWSVTGIDSAAGREILQTKGLELDEANPQGQELIDRYSGNPQALHLVATAIQREFLGDVDDFLEEEGAAVEDVRTLLDQHLTRLAPLERSILFWLAINREPVGLDELMEDLLPPVTKREVRSALRGLSDRYLIEAIDKQFTLQNVIMEFATDQFIHAVSEEIELNDINLINTHSVIKSTSKDYIKAAQRRLIVNPIISCLLDLKELSRRILEIIRNKQYLSQGYAAGNILNLLNFSGMNCREFNFSDMTIRHACLKNFNMVDTNFTGSKFIFPELMYAFGIITAVAFSADQIQLATGSSNGDIFVWSSLTGNFLKCFYGHDGWVRTISFSPDGKLLASGGDDTNLRIWDIQNGKCIYKFEAHNSSIRSVVFHPNGKQLASGGGDLKIYFWDLDSKQCTHIFDGHESWIRSIAFSSDGKILVSGGDDMVVRVWDVNTCQCSRVFKGHTNAILSVAFSPDNKMIASGSDDTTIRLWELQSRQPIYNFQGHTGVVRSIAFSPDGKRLAIGSGDTRIRLWDIIKRQFVGDLRGHTGSIRSVEFSSDGTKLLSGGDDATVRLWDVNSNKCINSFKGYINLVGAIAFSPNGNYFASANSDSIVSLWDAKSYEFIHPFEGHTNWARSIAFSRDSKYIASGSFDNTVRLLDVKSRQCKHVFEGHNGLIRSVSFSPDNTILASGSDDATVRIWNIKDNNFNFIDSLVGHTTVVGSVAFSCDGKILASGGGDSDIRIWSIENRQCLHRMDRHSSSVRSIDFSPNGEIMASGSGDMTVRIWDTKKFQCLSVLKGHTGVVRSISFNPIGDILASAGDDRSIRFWNSKSHECLQVLQGHDNVILAISFSPDGKVLASGDSDGNIQFWNVNTGKSIALLKSPRPYEGTDITGVQGLTEAQRTSMLVLGAIDCLATGEVDSSSIFD